MEQRVHNMSLYKLLQTAFQHWVILLIVLLATGPGAQAIGKQVKPVYESKATMLFLGPALVDTADGKGFLVNPFTKVGSAERVAANTVLVVSSTSLWQERMLKKGATGDYTYKQVSDAVVELVTTGQTPSESSTTMAVSIQLLQEELATRQERAGAPPESWIKSEVLAKTNVPTALLGSRIRATVGVAVLGVIAAISAALFAEAVGIGGRSRRRARRQHKREKQGIEADQSGDEATLAPNMENLGQR